MTLQQLRQIIAIADYGSMNEAAKQLFITQPSLSGMVKELEEEIGTTIFLRSNRGINITQEGAEFLIYARQVIDQYELLENRFMEQKVKKKFSVSAQHFSFAVKAFVEMVQKVGMDEYEFAIHETKTNEVIESVKSFSSELGILNLNDLNDQVMKKIIKDNNLEFIELFQCQSYVYLWEGHPLAGEKCISMEQLEPYPCISFEQGHKNSFHLAEEMKSTHEYKRIIKVDDRATVNNITVGLNGYTICAGVVCEELNTSGHITIPMTDADTMRLGYIKAKNSKISELGKLYIEELTKFGGNTL